MPQHDFNIANQLFPPTRADLNNAFAALQSNSSGTSAPGSPVAGQWWADTQNDVMKFRNTDNDEWIELFDLNEGTIIQPVTIEAVPVGSVLAWPGITVPAKWSLCDGSVLNRTDYPGLFNVLGTRYNTGGETSAQFRLPDMRGRTVVGRDDMGGTAAGRVSVGVSGVNGLTLGATGGHQALQTHDHVFVPTPHAHTGTVAPHDHGYTIAVVTNFGSGGGATRTTDLGAASTTSASPAVTINPETAGGSITTTGSGTGQNMMPCMVYNWIIFTGGVGAEGDGGGGTPEDTLGALEAIQFAAGDEATAIASTGVKITMRWPYEFVPTSVRASLNSACATGTFTITATVNAVALFSTSLTIDATEKTSKTAAVPAVLALTNIADDAEVIWTVSNVGDGTGTGLKVTVLGYRVIN